MQLEGEGEASSIQWFAIYTDCDCVTFAVQRPLLVEEQLNTASEKPNSKKWSEHLHRFSDTSCELQLEKQSCQ